MLNVFPVYEAQVSGRKVTIECWVTDFYTKDYRNLDHMFRVQINGRKVNDGTLWSKITVADCIATLDRKLARYSPRSQRHVIIDRTKEFARHNATRM